jgi:hypothetical protein
MSVLQILFRLELRSAVRLIRVETIIGVAGRSPIEDMIRSSARFGCATKVIGYRVLSPEEDKYLLL